MRRILGAFFLAFALLACAPATPAPQRLAVDAATQDTGNPNTKVWVNTASHVYHCPGTRWYGATKAGEYMTQKDAQAKGNRPAYGKYCQ